jgi:hypothetical protein
MTTDQVLFGGGLILVLAAGSQVRGRQFSEMLMQTITGVLFVSYRPD